MRCFVHHEVEAVGICRACGRALCPDCTAEVEGAVACKGRCEPLASALMKNLSGRDEALGRLEAALAASTAQRERAHATLLNSRRDARTYRRIAAIVGLVIAVLSLGVGAFDEKGRPFWLVIGTFLLVVGVVRLLLNRRLARVEKEQAAKGG